MTRTVPDTLTMPDQYRAGINGMLTRLAERQTDIARITIKHFIAPTDVLLSRGGREA